MTAPRDVKPEPGSGRFLATELGLRVASAVVLLVVVVLATWAGGLPFRLMSCALAGVLFYEWQRIVAVTRFDMPEAILTAGFGLMLVGALFDFFLPTLVLFVLVGIALELTRHGPERSDVRWIGMGALYCITAAVALPTIRDVGGTLGIALIFFLFLIVWVTDVAAYFTGRAMGGPKLMPSVSPKKTWSGGLGGLAGAMVVGALFGLYVEGFSILAGVLSAAVLSVSAQAGDFFESWIKRVHNAKDSSNLIPGHGGFLDRVDGLIAAAFPVAVVVALIQV